MEEELAMQKRQRTLWKEALQRERDAHRQLQTRLALASGAAGPALGADRSGGVADPAGAAAARSGILGLMAGSSAGAAVAGGGTISAVASARGGAAPSLIASQACGGSAPAITDAVAPPADGTAPGAGGRSVHYAQEEKAKTDKKGREKYVDENGTVWYTKGPKKDDDHSSSSSSS